MASFGKRVVSPESSGSEERAQRQLHVRARAGPRPAADRATDDEGTQAPLCCIVARRHHWRPHEHEQLWQMPGRPPAEPPLHRVGSVAYDVQSIANRSSATPATTATDGAWTRSAQQACAVRTTLRGARFLTGWYGRLSAREAMRAVLARLAARRRPCLACRLGTVDPDAPATGPKLRSQRAHPLL